MRAENYRGDLFTITSGDSGDSSKASLTLKNIVIDGNRAVVNYTVIKGEVYSGTLINIIDGGLIMQEGAILQNNFRRADSVGGGAVTMSGDGTFVMNDGEIKNNTSIYYTTYMSATQELKANISISSAVRAKGKFTMNGGKISGNIYRDSGTLFNSRVNNYDAGYGTISVEDGGIFTMNSGEITENECYYGGGVHISKLGKAIISGNIYNNKARHGAGVRNEGTVEIINGTINDNYASDGSGGGISNLGTLRIENSEIKGNYVQYDSFGGGLYNATGTAEIINSEISGNEVYQHGAGIYCGSGTVTITNSKINDNFSGFDYGSGVYNGKDGTVNVTNCEISGNIVGNRNNYQNPGYIRSGGGVYNNGVFNLNGSKIIGNNAEKCGGGVYNDINGTFNMTGGEISGNSADEESGGVYNDGVFNMNGGKISGNSAMLSVGGMYMGGTVIFGGTASVTDNKHNSVIIDGHIVGGENSNLYIAEGKSITFNTEENPPKEDMSIGLHADKVGSLIIDDVPEEYAGYLSSDVSSRIVSFEEGDSEGDSEGLGKLVLVGDDENPFGKLQNEALKYGEATQNITITLTEDIIADALLWIPAPKTPDVSITIAGNDKTVKLNKEIVEYFIIVSDEATLELRNTVIDAAGKRAINVSPLILVESDGEFFMHKGTVLKNQRGTYGCVEVKGSFTMNDGEISGNTSDYGGGVYIDTGVFTMRGGEIRGNTAIYSGGGVSVDKSSSFKMTGGKISGNIAGDIGSGVYVNTTGTATFGGEAIVKDNFKGGENSNVFISAGKYIDVDTNERPTSGMDVWVQTESADGVFASNGASQANAQYFKSDITSKKVSFSDNKLILVNDDDSPWIKFKNQIEAYAAADEDVIIEVTEDLLAEALITIPTPKNDNVTLTIKSGVSRDNEDEEGGEEEDSQDSQDSQDSVEIRTIKRGSNLIGDLFTVADKAKLILDDITIDGNIYNTNARGSLLRVTSSSTTVTIENGVTFQNNSYPGGNSGVIYMDNGAVNMNGGKIINNDVRGIKIVRGEFTMYDGEVSGNVGGVTIGDYVNSAHTIGIFNMYGGEISGNTSLSGGGVYFYNGTFRLGGSAVIRNNYNNMEPNNVYIKKDYYITLGTDEYEPTDDMLIWVQTESSNGVVVNSGALEKHVKYFESDIPGKGIKHESGSLVLVAPIQGTVGVTGTAMYGQELTATALNDAPGDLVNMTHQWKRDGFVITGANNGTYKLTAEDVGKEITYTVYASNYGGYISSEPTAKVAKAPLTPGINSAGVEGKTYDGTTTITGTVMPTITLSGAINEETPTATASYSFTTADAGENKSITATDIELTTFADRYELAATTVDAVSGVEITKTGGLTATDPAVIPIRPTDTNEYTFDLDSIVLDKDDCGERTYKLGTLTDNNSILQSVSLDSTNNNLLKYKGSGAASNTATQVVNITTTNYTDITATITFEATENANISANIVFNDGTEFYNREGIEYKKAKYNNSDANFTYSYDVADPANGAQLVYGLPYTPGDYIVTASYDKGGYTGTKTVKLTILPKELTVNVTVQEKDFDGTTAATLSQADLVGVVSGDDVRLADVSMTATFTSLNVGDAVPVELPEFSITGNNIANYTLEQPSGVTGKILMITGLWSNPTTVLVHPGTTYPQVFDLNTISYNYSNHGDRLYRVTGFKNDQGVLVDVPVISTTENNKLTYQGTGKTTGTASLTITVTSENYDITTATIDFIASQKTDISDDIFFEDGVAEYARSELTHETASYEGAGTIQYTYAEDTSVTPNNASLSGNGKPFTAGSYTVTAKYEDEGKIGSKTVRFVVEQKELTANVTLVPKVYDGTWDGTVGAAELVGVLGTEGDKDDVEIVNGTVTYEDKNVGTGIKVSFDEFTLKGENAGNYTLKQPADQTAAITQSGALPAPKTVVIYVRPEQTSEQTFNLSQIALAKDDCETIGYSVGALLDDEEDDILNGEVSLGGTDNNLLTYKGNGKTSGEINLSVTIITRNYIPVSVIIKFVATEKADISDIIAFEHGIETYTREVIAYEAATYNGLGDNFTYTYEIDPVNPDGAELKDDLPFKAGNYIVTATYTDEGRIGNKTATFTITQAELTVDVEVSDKTFDGTDAVTIESAVLKGVLIGDDVSLVHGNPTFADANAGTGKAITFDFSITGNDIANYKIIQPTGKTANIAKGKVNPTYPKIYIQSTETDPKTFDLDSIALNKEFDCGTRSYELTGILDDGFGILSDPVTLSGTNNATLNYQGSGQTTGEATQIVKITTDNYEDAYVVITFVATNKTDISNQIQFVDGDKAYSRNEQKYETAKYMGDGSKFTYTYKVSDDTPNSSLSTGDKLPLTAGKYIVTAMYSDDDSIGSKTAVFTITPVELTVTDVILEDKIYDGSADGEVISATLNGVLGTDDDKDEVTFEYGTAAFTSINAGTGITVNLEGFAIKGKTSGNYTLLQPADITASIAKSNALSAEDITITILPDDNEEHTFDLDDIELNKDDYGDISYELGDFGGKTSVLTSDKVKLNANNTITYQGAGTTSGAATQEIKITTTNYEEITVVITFFTNLKTDISDDIEFEPGEKPYARMGLTHENATYSGGNGTFTYKYEEDKTDPDGATVVDEKPYTAGNYTVTVTYEDAGNKGTKTVAFKVTRVELSITDVILEEKFYNGTTAGKVKSATLNGVLFDDDGKDDVTLKYGTATFDTADVGNDIEVTFAGFTIVGTDASNYTLKQPNKTTAEIKLRYGDVNGDNAVDDHDLTALKQYLANWNGVTINKNLADVYFDKAVNDIDTVILKRYLLGWKVILGQQ